MKAKKEPLPPPVLIDEKELASMIHMSIAWVRADRHGKRLFPFIKIGKAVRYDLEAVRAALTEMTQGGAK